MSPGPDVTTAPHQIPMGFPLASVRRPQAAGNSPTGRHTTCKQGDRSNPPPRVGCSDTMLRVSIGSTVCRRHCRYLMHLERPMTKTCTPPSAPAERVTYTVCPSHPNAPQTDVSVLFPRIREAENRGPVDCKEQCGRWGGPGGGGGRRFVCTNFRAIRPSVNAYGLSLDWVVAVLEDHPEILDECGRW